MSCLQQIIVIIDGGGCEGLHIPTLFQYVSFVQSTDTNVDYLQVYGSYHVSGTSGLQSKWCRDIGESLSSSWSWWVDFCLFVGNRDWKIASPKSSKQARFIDISDQRDRLALPEKLQSRFAFSQVFSSWSSYTIAWRLCKGDIGVLISDNDRLSNTSLASGFIPTNNRVKRQFQTFSTPPLMPFSKSHHSCHRGPWADRPCRKGISSPPCALTHPH